MSEASTQEQQLPLTLDQLRVCVVVASDLHVLNISQSGCALQTEKPLTMGKIYSLQMMFDSQSVTIDGEVARCNLSEIADFPDGHQSPLYLNGIHFQIDRNPLELSLLDILHDNILGEKRRMGHRVRPLRTIIAHVGRPCFSAIEELTSTGILLESTELIDLDQDWELMIQAAGHSVRVPVRVLHASKRDDAAHYDMKMEFLPLSEDQRAFLDGLITRLSAS